MNLRCNPVLFVQVICPRTKALTAYLTNSYNRRQVDVKDDPFVTMERAWGSAQWRNLPGATSSGWVMEQETELSSSLYLPLVH